MIYIYIGIALVVVIPLFLYANKRYMNLLVERRIAVYQNDIIARHCNEVENIYKTMRGWRHDYHNHIGAMKVCLALDQKQELSDYLGKLDDDLVSVDSILKTGNVMVDAILNSKISLAQSKKITVNAKAVVPKGLYVQDVDLCVILGNLLDNAIEACTAADNETPWIRVYIGLHKELFYISVSNALTGEIKRTGLLYASTKSKPNHGFGLIRIDKITEKYGGFVDRQNELGVFVTEVMIPLSYNQ